MSSISRKLKRQQQKNSGTLIHKKVIAKKLGCSVKELNEKLSRKEENLKTMEDNGNGGE